MIKNKKRDEQSMIIDDYNSTKKQKEIQCDLSKTIGANKRINYSYGNYATNKIKFKHPQIYILNNCFTPMRNKLPPINDKNAEKLKRIDLLSRNDSEFEQLFNKKEKKYDNYYMAIKIGKALKYKFH